MGRRDRQVLRPQPAGLPHPSSRLPVLNRSSGRANAEFRWCGQRSGGTRRASGRPPRLLDRSARSRPDPEESGRLDELTAREREVLRLVAEGNSNAEIAATLHLTEHTVKTHVSRMLAKTGLRDRVQAVILAYDTGLVEPRPTDQRRSP
ncbi:LuxR C-terminal-related transcriptional regulator [Kribbella flavida]|uniref:LuxR C-terminal-related transcriptional regulator n=1 Tax=Kribbella flavida TaxID=182640 RepID=UPI000A066707